MAENPAVWPVFGPWRRPAACGIVGRKPSGSLAVIWRHARRGAKSDMAEDTLTTAGIGNHGAARLPSVDIDSYNIELKDDDGFLGDRASKGAFQAILDNWRKQLKKNGEDPLGAKSTEEISKKKLDAVLVGDDVEASALVHTPSRSSPRSSPM